MAIKNDRPGAFELSEVVLMSYANNAEGTPTRLNIRNLVTEIKIYESLDNTFLTGDMTLVDATNVIQQLPLSGFERLELRFNSPGTDLGYNFSVEKGHPMFVYNLQNRQGINPNTQMYTLNFISMEAIRDQQTRISKAYAGSIDTMIDSICNEYLKTKKDVIIEETKGVYKIVVPRIKPISAITMLKRNARSKYFENSGFVFYEDANGFHFKSYEGLFCKADGSPRTSKITYSPRPKNISVKGDVGHDEHNTQSVESFKVISQYDTLKSTAEGAYASRLITHDLFNKTFKEHDFNYHTEYSKQRHLESDFRGDISDNNSKLPYFNFDNGDTFALKPEGTLHFQSSTAKVHNDYNQLEPDLILQKRISQRSLTNALKIEIVVPGFSEIRVGDIVNFDMPDFKATPREDKRGVDEYLSGRYLISSVMHHVSSINKRHTMVMELIKDSYNEGMPGEVFDTFTNNENDNGKTYISSQLDEYIL
jgi:hypothetical protein